MEGLKVMHMILNRHKENLDYYDNDKNIHGVNHCEQMIFDWKVRIAMVESFRGKQKKVKSFDDIGFLTYSIITIGFMFLLFTYCVECI